MQNNLKNSGKDMIRVGVVGAGRGGSFASRANELVGMKLVALCDTREDKLEAMGKQYDVATYRSYEDFLAHDMDAVVLANYFHEHAPFAIKALNAGKHVMSETAACKTLAEGVELCRTVEDTDLIYMFAENYPYSKANQELRRLYQDGEIGEVRYAEGEYNHPMPEQNRLSISPGLEHWRNWIPPTYYCSHGLAPLMCITDTMPVSVNALSIVEKRTQSPHTTKVSDVGDVILARMDNGAVFRIWGLMLSSIHRVKYEIHGERGLIRTAEPNHWTNVHIHHENWLREKGQRTDVTYAADWPEHGDMADRSGHGGGDFWMNFHFGNAIRSGQSPYLDVYRGVAMAAVGIGGWKSCLQNGEPFQIPNFRDEKDRSQFENDDWSPFPGDAGPQSVPPSIQGYIEPSDEVKDEAMQMWQDQGYKKE
ncbi:MAG: Gfo/Idh/MocA family protein [Candidatus Brocadiia bacterium]